MGLVRLVKLLVLCGFIRLVLIEDVGLVLVVSVVLLSLRQELSLWKSDSQRRVELEVQIFEPRGV